ncbi:MAG TPA: thioredoxin domain-containing protein [Candidatus Saccharimonadales bacterium]|jgi:protein-disulfide isomerase|nr:thioredoxin domain-containing protein [Candidatus Saccharimonadales bacterium]
MSKEEKSPRSIQQYFLPAVVILAIVLAFVSGSLWQKVKSLESGGATATGTTTTQQKTPGIGNDKTQSGKLANFLKSVIDTSFMKSCLDSGKYDARLQSDQALATSLGIQGTPGFIVGTTAYPGAYSWTDMQATVNSILQGKQLPAGSPSNAPKVTMDQIKALWSKDLVKFGDANRKVLFVEMADPSCPFCHAADGQNHTIYKSLGGTTFQLQADGGSYVSPTVEMKKLVDSGEASYVYIYYPGHGNGEMGMKALYCANEQGKFWEAHALIMSDAGYTLMNGS